MGESAHILLPTKFVLLVGQVLLLVIVLGNKQYHIYQEIGETLSSDAEQYQAAEKTLVGLSACWICLCFVEFLMMIVGSSVPHMFAQWNLL